MNALLFKKKQLSHLMLIARMDRRQARLRLCLISFLPIEVIVSHGPEQSTAGHAQARDRLLIQNPFQFDI